MVIADASGLPLALHTDSAGPHEVTLVQATLDEIVTVGQPRRIIGDRAYDSDPLDNALAAQGIEMIAPHRRNRKRRVLHKECYNDILQLRSSLCNTVQNVRQSGL